MKYESLKSKMRKLGFRIWNLGFSRETKRESLCSLCVLWFNKFFGSWDGILDSDSWLLDSFLIKGV